MGRYMPAATGYETGYERAKFPPKVRHPCPLAKAAIKMGLTPMMRGLGILRTPSRGVPAFHRFRQGAC